jgi:hypothetical protein
MKLCHYDRKLFMKPHSHMQISKDFYKHFEGLKINYRLNEWTPKMETHIKNLIIRRSYENYLRVYWTG